LLTRAEGLPLRQALWSGLCYLRKWRHPKTTAPPEELRYFDQQRQLVSQLAREPAGSGSGVRLAMVGDLMWLRHSWDSFLDPTVLHYLNDHDVVVGNLESPISSRNPVPHFFPDYLTYNSDPRLITSFRRPDGSNSFTALAVCNNHCLDRGDAGALDTLDFLESQGVLHSGIRRDAGQPTFVTWRSKGIAFGLYAACWGLNDPRLLQTTRLQIEVLPGLVPRVKRPIDLTGVRRALSGMAAAGVDFKLVYLHWGYEFEFYPCPDLMQIGREIIRAGADVVIGSHPHVVQPVEVCFVNGYEKQYQARWPALLALTADNGCLINDNCGTPRKGLIAYSLGDFATVMFTLHCRIGLVLDLEVRRDGRGRADWFRPGFGWVVNVLQEGVSRRHRLVLLDHYLARRAAAGRRDSRLRSLAQSIREHVMPSQQTPQELLPESAGAKTSRSVTRYKSTTLKVPSGL
jgi:poly-gamma-glutamate synthesis protein (capsule biosynthesis protein)